jgi:hypothetical protein
MFRESLDRAMDFPPAACSLSAREKTKEKKTCKNRKHLTAQQSLPPTFHETKQQQSARILPLFSFKEQTKLAIKKGKDFPPFPLSLASVGLRIELSV